MFRYIFFGTLIIFSAVSILIVSLVRSSETRYEFNNVYNDISTKENGSVLYSLPYAGEVNPFHPLWPLKVARDRLAVFLATTSLNKAEVLLNISDKRLGTAKRMFDEGREEAAISVFTKSEKYLEKAASEAIKSHYEGQNIDVFVMRLASSALKHREVLEDVLVRAPEEAKPVVVKTMDLAKETYSAASKYLIENGFETPVSPFEN